MFTPTIVLEQRRGWVNLSSHSASATKRKPVWYGRIKENKRRRKIVERRGWLERLSTGKLQGVEETKFDLTSLGF